MQLFGLVSLLVTVLLGVMWLVNSSNISGRSGASDVGVDYQGAIDSARAIPGAPSSTIKTNR